MKWFKRVLKALLVLLGLVVVAALALFIYVQVAYNVDYPNTPLPKIAASKDPEVIKRGEYIVHHVAHCDACHGPAELAKQHEVDFTKPLEGGYTIHAGPFGTFTARNLTPDPTGIGSLSDGQIARTVRHGVDSRGKLSPIMRVAVGPMSDEDLTAVISYLRAQKPVEAKRPWYELGFIGKVVALKLRPRTETAPPYVPEGEISVERGRYLAQGPAMCAGCHTPHNALGGFTLSGSPFSGADEANENEFNSAEEIISPNLTPDPATGHITSWTEDAFVARFRAGRVVKGSKMPWDAFQGMTESDLRSIYRFLKTLPPVKHYVGPTVRPS
jgi:mono/diheme cytochrome c family protein